MPNGQELLDEMQGIAEGAGMSFYDIVARNFTYDLGERTACSTALIPRTSNGPILINTLDDDPSGKHRQNIPAFIQVAYPVMPWFSCVTMNRFGRIGD